MDKELLEKVKRLRESTGLSISDCKKALVESNGNEEEAIRILEKQGSLKAESKLGREAKEGVVGYYIHQNNKLGVLVELNCETDFVARTDDFKNLAHDLAVHIAAMDPIFLDKESVPNEIKQREAENFDEFCKQTCLVEQEFFKDSSKTVKELISSYVAKFGENIRIGKFHRMVIG